MSGRAGKTRTQKLNFSQFKLIAEASYESKEVSVEGKSFFLAHKNMKPEESNFTTTRPLGRTAY